MHYYFSSGHIVILNQRLCTDTRVIELIAGNKNFQLAFNILQDVDNGIYLLYKDALESIQNTTLENYPTMIMAFISDVQNSAKLLIDSILNLYKTDKLKGLISQEFTLFGHKIRIDEKEGRLIDETALEEFFVFMNKIAIPKAITLVDHIRQNYRNITFQSDNKKFFDSLYKDSPYPELPINKENFIDAAFHPVYVGGLLRETVEWLDKSKLNHQVAEAAAFFLRREFGSIFNGAYFSQNVHEFKFIPKGGRLYPYDTPDGKKGRVLALNGFKMSKKSGPIVNRKISLDFDASFFIQQKILEYACKSSFDVFIGAARDFLAKDLYRRSPKKRSNGNMITENYLAVAEECDNKIAQVRQLYDKCVIGLLQEANSPEINKQKLSQLNIIARKQIEAVLQRYLKNELFVQHQQEEMYLKKCFDLILSLYYQNPGGPAQKSSFVHFHIDRATFHSNLAFSYVFDYRERATTKFSDGTNILFSSENKSLELMHAIERHRFHDFVEIDPELFRGVGVDSLIDFFNATNNLPLPVFHKCALRFRRLGNFHASGIYFSHSKTMGVDLRYCFSAYIHEMAHHIDLSRKFVNRAKMISVLYGYFSPRITKNRKYYLNNEELIARAAEIAMLLRVGNYRLHKGHTNPKEIIERTRKSFEQSDISQFMKSWDDYATSDEFIAIEEEITKKDSDLLNTLEAYFSEFWGWFDFDTADKSNTYLSKASVAGHISKRDIPYNASDYSMLVNMKELLKLKYPSFTYQEILASKCAFMLEKLPAWSKKQMQSGIEQKIAKEEDILTIKKLWNVYIKCSNDEQFYAFLSQKNIVVSPNSNTLQKVKDDFKNKFRDHISWPQLSKKLDDMLLALVTISK